MDTKGGVLVEKKIIPKEIKEEVLVKVKAGERVSALVEQYGISTNSIYTWLSKEAGHEIISTLKYNKLKRENEELKRLIGELTLDVSLVEKIELVKAGSNKSVRALALGINRKNIYKERKLIKRDLALIQDICQCSQRASCIWP